MSGFQIEQNYIYSVIFDDYLGLNLSEFELLEEGAELVISRQGKKMTLSNEFFAQSLVDYLNIGSLPIHPLDVMELSGVELFKEVVEKTIPIVYGNSNVTINDTEIYLGLDVFGTSFFMLSRYEEVVNTERDEQDRFSAYSSVAYKNGFLERPIIDEYVDILWICMHHLWPDLRRKEHKFRHLVSCDVDFAWDRRLKFPLVIKTFLGDILKRRSFSTALKTLVNFISRKNPFATFDFLMDTCELSKSELAFYFIAQDNKELINGDYDISSEFATNLIKEIHRRGHEVGLHPSYNTYRSLNQTKREIEALQNVLKNQGLEIDIIGGRQHYLRWSTPETARNWESIGLMYDSTLGYADHVGFRCGTCKEYRFYDVKERRPMDLIIRPLIAMEVTLLSGDYMSLTSGQAERKLLELKRICENFNGNFVMLWHNNYFDQPEYFDVYKNVIQYE